MSEAVYDEIDYEPLLYVRAPLPPPERHTFGRVAVQVRYRYVGDTRDTAAVARVTVDKRGLSGLADTIAVQRDSREAWAKVRAEGWRVEK